MKKSLFIAGILILSVLFLFEHRSLSQTGSSENITTVSWPDGVHLHVQDLLTDLANHCDVVGDRLVLEISEGIFEDETIKWPILASVSPVNILCPKPINIRGAGIGKTVFLDRNLGTDIPLPQIELGEGTVEVPFPAIQDVEISHMTIQVVGDPDPLKHRNFSVALGHVKGAKIHDLEMLGRRRGMVCLICEDTEIYNNRIVGTGTMISNPPARTDPSHCIDIQRIGSNHNIHHNDLSNCVRGVNVAEFMGIQEDADIHHNLIHDVSNGIVCVNSDRCSSHHNIIDGTLVRGISYAGSNEGDIHHNLLCNVGGTSSPIGVGATGFVTTGNQIHHNQAEKDPVAVVFNPAIDVDNEVFNNTFDEGLVCQ